MGTARGRAAWRGSLAAFVLILAAMPVLALPERPQVPASLVVASDDVMARIRARLAHAARIGSRGEPDISVTFDTRICGVVLSNELRERYPQEITIILQYQFENLVVTDSGFEVDLWFSGRRERVRVPFAAVSAFYEPKENFAAKFTPNLEGGCGRPT